MEAQNRLKDALVREVRQARGIEISLETAWVVAQTVCLRILSAACSAGDRSEIGREFGKWSSNAVAAVGRGGAIAT